jgi:hypothetical protein
MRLLCLLHPLSYYGYKADAHLSICAQFKELSWFAWAFVIEYSKIKLKSRGKTHVYSLGHSEQEIYSINFCLYGLCESRLNAFLSTHLVSGGQ